MSENIEPSCPLGHKCRTYDESGLIDICAWYVKISGKHPQSDEMVEEYRCYNAWQPVLELENTQTVRGLSKTMASFRNEMVKKQDVNSSIVSLMQAVLDQLIAQQKTTQQLLIQQNNIPDPLLMHLEPKHKHE